MAEQGIDYNAPSVPMTRSRANFEQNVAVQSMHSQPSSVTDGQHEPEYVFSSEDSYSESDEEDDYSSGEEFVPNSTTNGNTAKSSQPRQQHHPLPPFSGQTFPSVPVIHDYSQSHMMYVQNVASHHQPLPNSYSNGMTSVHSNIYTNSAVNYAPQVMYDPHQYLAHSRQPIMTCQQPISVSNAYYGHGISGIQGQCLVVRGPQVMTTAPLPRTTITQDHNYTDLNGSITPSCSPVILSTAGVNHYNSHFLVKQSHSLPLESHNNVMTSVSNVTSYVNGGVHVNGICHENNQDECLQNEDALDDLLTD